MAGWEGILPAGRWGLTFLILPALIAVFPQARRASLSLALHGAVFLCAGLLAAVQRPPEIIPPGGRWAGIGVVLELPQAKTRTYQTKLRLPGERGLCSIVYLQKDERSYHLVPGDRVYLQTRWSPVAPPDLPGSFHYAAYLARQHCFYTGYVRSNDWMLLPGTAAGTGITRRAARFRDRAAKILTGRLAPPTGGLATAMLLGDKSMLESMTRTAFAQAGIMHILAVSGLHVSIIYLLVASVHRPFTRRYCKWIPVATAGEVVAIWAFACVTGLGPSVQRAAIMFSLFALSKTLRQDADILNITAASALVVLILEPAMLFSPGFLLSYSAVYGILLIYPKIAPLLTFRSGLARWIWQLEVVSFSAVAGTTPLSLLYFGQFPLVFPLSNLLAIPAAFTLVSGAVLLLVISPIQWLALPIAWVLQLTGSGLVQATTRISGLPRSHISQISWNAEQSWLLLFFIGTATLFLYVPMHRKRRMALLVLFLLTGMFLQRGILYSRVYAGREVHTSSKQDQVWLTCGKRLYYLKDSTQADAFRMPDDGFRRHARIRQAETFNVSPERLEEVIRLTGGGRRGSP